MEDTIEIPSIAHIYVTLQLPSKSDLCELNILVYTSVCLIISRNPMLRYLALSLEIVRWFKRA